MATLILEDQEGPCATCGGNPLICGCNPFDQFAELLPEPSRWKRFTAWLAGHCPWCNQRMIYVSRFMGPKLTMLSYCPRGHRAVYETWNHRRVVEEAHGGVLLALAKTVPRRCQAPRS